MRYHDGQIARLGDEVDLAGNAGKVVCLIDSTNTLTRSRMTAMKFLSRNEAGLLEKKLRRELAEHADPKFVLYSQSDGRDYSRAADAIARSAGRFSEATLLFQYCLCGDGWDEHRSWDEQWKRYRSWRAANGDSRRLDHAPGRRFEAGEVEQLSGTIAFALELGWDAVVSAKPGRQLLFLSHDDRLEIYRGFGAGALVRELIALGDWRRAGR
jgi:hypothetical protein